MNSSKKHTNRTWFAWTLGSFISLWLIINLIQAYFSQIIGDEGYYWYYSQHLQFGYFDHPPIIAILIRLSSLLFDQNLGIRFGTILMSAGTMVLLWLLMPKSQRFSKKAVLLLLALITMMPAIHIYGFISTPDAPLLFFTALFLFAHHRFIQKQNLLSLLFLAVSSALILYAKYHGAIIILFSLLAYPRVFKYYQLYIAGFIALILLFPHIQWQIEHRWVSIDFHLLNRANRDYKAWFPTNYVSGVLGMLNPVLIGLFVFFKWKNRVRSRNNEKEVDFNLIYGRLCLITLGFFLFFSFFMRIEAHWIVAISIPLILFVHHELLKSNKFNAKGKLELGVLGLFILIFGAARILLILPLNLKTEFHDKRISQQHFQRIEEKSKDLPVVFIDSYKNASLYWFYTGSPAYTLTNHKYRESQFELDSNFQKWHGKQIYLLSNWKSSGLFGQVELESGTTIFPTYYPNFQVLGEVYAETPSLANPLNNKELHPINLTLHNPNGHALQFGKNRDLELLMLFRKSSTNIYVPIECEDFTIEARNELKIKGLFKADKVPVGDYQALILAKQQKVLPQEISRPIKIVVD